MKNLAFFTILVINLLYSCTSQKKLAYLNNLPETSEEQFFTMSIPNYKIQPRDILYITIKAMTPDGTIIDFLSSSRSGTGSSLYAQSEAGGYLLGYDVNTEGEIIMPVLGKIKVGGITLDDVRGLIQEAANKRFNNATVECKLLSFKYTVIGEVRAPGSYVNYNNYLTVLEAVGRAGGISDLGRRDKILIVRPIDGGTKTYTLNLQDKAILSSEAYFLLPNDVVIVEAESKKIFNLNFQTFSAIIGAALSVLSTTLLLINYVGNN